MANACPSIPPCYWIQSESLALFLFDLQLLRTQTSQEQSFVLNPKPLKSKLCLSLLVWSGHHVEGTKSLKSKRYCLSALLYEAHWCECCTSVMILYRTCSQQVLGGAEEFPPKTDQQKEEGLCERWMLKMRKWVDDEEEESLREVLQLSHPTSVYTRRRFSCG